MGIEAIESKVVMKVASVINVVSRPYFKQRIVPYVATGIAITTVFIFTTNSEKPSDFVT